LANVTGLSELKLSAMAGRQLPFFSCIVPAWLVCMIGGWRGLVAVWPAVVTCGVSFALVQFGISNYHGPWLVDLVGGLVSLASLMLLLRVWQPAGADPVSVDPSTEPQLPYSRRAIAKAWVPWFLLMLLVFLWALPPVKSALGAVSASERNALDASSDQFLWRATAVTVKMPALHRRVARVPPAVMEPEVEKAFFDFNWLSATGSGIFVAALLSAAWLGVSPRRLVSILFTTSRRMADPLATIACMLALAFVSRYSGMDAALGLLFTRAGWAYPFLAAVLGWLGVALTGSDTSSNALFGSLQAITARRLVLAHGFPLTEAQASILLVTANSTGGVMGKMIDAQSIVVAATVSEAPGQEGIILRRIFWHSVLLVFLMGLLVMLQAYCWPGMIPN
jgi:lactate permease